VLIPGLFFEGEEINCTNTETGKTVVGTVVQTGRNNTFSVVLNEAKDVRLEFKPGRNESVYVARFVILGIAQYEFTVRTDL